MNTAAGGGWTVSEILQRQGAVDEQHKLSARELCLLLGVSNRKLGAMIEDERQEGFAICSVWRGRGGYFLANPRAPDGIAAIVDCCQSLTNRAERMKETADWLLAAVEERG